jgi:hypothetical protein
MLHAEQAHPDLCVSTPRDGCVIDANERRHELQAQDLPWWCCCCDAQEEQPHPRP